VTPRLRIETLLVAARRAFGPRRDPALVHALAVESGLHAANVSRALDEVLELEPTDEELALMIERAPERTAVLVILAANVFLAPFRAIAWALAESERVIVRTSRRAPTFARTLIEHVPALGIELLPLSDDAARDMREAIAALPAGAAVHAYGTSATIDAVAEAAALRGIHAELHGPGFGAIVAESEAIIANAEAIARDVSFFDQGGCLSPRVVLAIGNSSAAVDALHRALARVGDEVPRRTLDPVESSALARSRDAAIFAGRALEGSEHIVLELPEATLAPPGRALVVVPATSSADALSRLRALGTELATIGTSSDLEGVVRSSFPSVRVAHLGRMQRPPLDGPVDLRTLAE
jgi:acyl-CoA reductase-like NAD-dependent aldehyde dehydrogenase